MPALNEEDLKRLRMEMERCSECLQWVFKNYCRSHDEFFHYGHLPTCSRFVQDDRAAHRLGSPECRTY